MAGLIIFFVIVIGAAAVIGWYHNGQMKNAKSKIKPGLCFKIYNGDPFKWGWKEVRIINVSHEYVQMIIHYMMPTGQEMYQEQISTRITDVVDTLTKSNIEYLDSKNNVI